MLDEITYLLRARWCRSDISRGCSSARGVHVLSVDTLIPPHQRSSFKCWVRQRTGWGHVQAMTSAEFVQMLDEITYLLMGHTCVTSAESIQMLDENTYFLREHPGCDISWVHSKAGCVLTIWGSINAVTSAGFIWISGRVRVLAEGTSRPRRPQGWFKCWKKPRTC